MKKYTISKQPMFTLLPNHLLIFIWLLYPCLIFCKQVCNHQDQSALFDFSKKISPSSSLPLNWSSQVSCCRWKGVECDINGRIIHLHLPSKGLKGMITSSISNLTMLTYLNLSNNYLHETLPKEISSLTNLRIVDLSSNSISGSIPREIGKLLYLEKLHLYNNNFSDHIPSSLMNCTNLIEIILRDNRLNGDISKLDFSRLVKLKKLDLKNNSLSGTLPESIYSCKSLIALRVAENIITGQISSKIIELKSLSFISLSQNFLTNITTTLALLAKCKNLTSLFLSANFIGETLPVHKNFISLDEFPKIQFFFLEKCEFAAGPVPNWLANLKSLRFLSLDGNRMTGKVPIWFVTLPKLVRLELDNNSLYGELPIELCQLPGMISQNVQLDLQFSQFELPVFIFRGNVNTYLRFKVDYSFRLGLSYNALSGTIPQEIGNLKNIQELDLNNNRFHGHIPDNISKLTNLEVLNLSSNNLVGEIPTSLVSLTFMSHFDVSYNNLEGQIPDGGQLGTFQASNFEGNPGLCGEPLDHPCSIPTISRETDIKESYTNKQQFHDGLAVGFASGFTVIVVVIRIYVWLKSYKIRQPFSRRR